MFPKNHWYVAATSEEMGTALLARWILNEPIVMYRTQAGKPVALRDMCPHRSYPLSKGALEGDNLRCNYHGLVFEPGGKCIHIPAQRNIAPRCRTTTYPLVEKWRWIWIWMGDPALADESSIPDMHWNHDPHWIPTGGRFDIRCHYQLMIDNLMDLTHETYVHANTIGNRAVAETPCTTQIQARLVRTIREMKDCPPPPDFVRWLDFRGNIDRTQHITFIPPCYVVIQAKAVPHANREAPSLEYWVLSGVTPATAETSHYFWSVPRNFAPDPAFTRVFHDSCVRIISQDIPVLETQQESMNRRRPDARWVDINADSGALAARRIVDSLLEEEQS